MGLVAGTYGPRHPYIAVGVGFLLFFIGLGIDYFISKIPIINLIPFLGLLISLFLYYIAWKKLKFSLVGLIVGWIVAFLIGAIFIAAIIGLLIGVCLGSPTICNIPPP